MSRRQTNGIPVFAEMPFGYFLSGLADVSTPAFRIMNRVLGRARCFIDMMDDAAFAARALQDRLLSRATSSAEPAYVQQLDGFMQTSWAIQLGVYRRMIVDVLAIVDSGLFHFTDRCLDLRQRHIFITVDARVARAVLDHPLCRAQIRKGVNVGRVARFFANINGSRGLCRASA